MFKWPKYWLLAVRARQDHEQWKVKRSWFNCSAAPGR